MVCSAGRRSLMQDGSVVTESASKLRRSLQTSGFIFVMSAKCRSCGPDNKDARRRLVSSSPITIRVKTDEYPQEFSYLIVKPKTSNGASQTTVYASSGIVLPNATYVQTLYLEPLLRHQIVLRDSYGDGICCQYGRGSVQVIAGTSVNGKTILYDAGDFGYTRGLFFTTPAAPTVVLSSTTLIDLNDLQRKYSEYLTYYIQQTYHTDSKSCLYGTFPSVAVTLKEITKTQAFSTC